MNFRSLVCLGVFGALASFSSAQKAKENEEFNPDEVNGPNVKVIENKSDGTRSMFYRSADNKVITKRTYSNKVLNLVTIYRMDNAQNPMNCKIYDGQMTELFKAAYGYRKTDGNLIEERMFDSRVKRVDPVSGKEMPVRRVIYTYDSAGTRSAGTSITLTPGKRAEEIFNTEVKGAQNPFKGK